MDLLRYATLAAALRADIRSGALSPEAYRYAVEELYRVERELEATKERNEISNDSSPSGV